MPGRCRSGIHSRSSSSPTIDEHVADRDPGVPADALVEDVPRAGAERASITRLIPMPNTARPATHRASRSGNRSRSASTGVVSSRSASCTRSTLPILSSPSLVASVPGIAPGIPPRSPGTGTVSHPFVRIGDMSIPHVFTQRCASCEATDETLCRSCRFALAATMAVTTAGGIAAAVPFDGPARQAILSLKYRNRRQVAKHLAGMMVRRLQLGAKGTRRFDVVTWAPTSAGRVRRRGYDQAELLAREVAKQLGVPCRRLLYRAHGDPQTGRTRMQRLVGPAFRARPVSAGSARPRRRRRRHHRRDAAQRRAGTARGGRRSRHARRGGGDARPVGIRRSSPGLLAAQRPRPGELRPDDGAAPADEPHE